jgi:DNA-directed RNA polymerase II subunit RPB1
MVSKNFIEAENISGNIQHPKIIEAKITEKLGNAKDIGNKISKDGMDKNNNFASTVLSGSKGDFFNIAQITSLLGQQQLGGERIQPMIDKRRRTLPHYKKNIENTEKKFESRGFIRNSFMKGLNPREFFFHAMSGREGVSDTAMKTAKSGYIQRRMIKIMEDVQVKTDGTVRNSTNNIIQWAYGDDGLDRAQTVVMNDKTEVVDISRLADRLNTKFEFSS